MVDLWPCVRLARGARGGGPGSASRRRWGRGGGGRGGRRRGAGPDRGPTVPNRRASPVPQRVFPRSHALLPPPRPWCAQHPRPRHPLRALESHDAGVASITTLTGRRALACHVPLRLQLRPSGRSPADFHVGRGPAGSVRARRRGPRGAGVEKNGLNFVVVSVGLLDPTFTPHPLGGPPAPHQPAATTSPAGGRCRVEGGFGGEGKRREASSRPFQRPAVSCGSPGPRGAPATRGVSRADTGAEVRVIVLASASEPRGRRALKRFRTRSDTGGSRSLPLYRGERRARARTEDGSASFRARSRGHTCGRGRPRRGGEVRAGPKRRGGPGGRRRGRGKT